MAAAGGSRGGTKRPRGSSGRRTGGAGQPRAAKTAAKEALQVTVSVDAWDYKWQWTVWDCSCLRRLGGTGRARVGWRLCKPDILWLFAVAEESGTPRLPRPDAPACAVGSSTLTTFAALAKDEPYKPELYKLDFDNFHDILVDVSVERVRTARARAALTPTLASRAARRYSVTYTAETVEEGDEEAALEMGTRADLSCQWSEVPSALKRGVQALCCGTELEDSAAVKMVADCIVAARMLHPPDQWHLWQGTPRLPEAQAARMHATVLHVNPATQTFSVGMLALSVKGRYVAGGTSAGDCKRRGTWDVKLVLARGRRDWWTTGTARQNVSGGPDTLATDVEYTPHVWDTAEEGMQPLLYLHDWPHNAAGLHTQETVKRPTQRGDGQASDEEASDKDSGATCATCSSAYGAGMASSVTTHTSGDAFVALNDDDVIAFLHKVGMD